jgi:hypothetical protein
LTLIYRGCAAVSARAQANVLNPPVGSFPTGIFSSSFSFPLLVSKEQTFLFTGHFDRDHFDGDLYTSSQMREQELNTAIVEA